MWRKNNVHISTYSVRGVFQADVLAVLTDLRDGYGTGGCSL